MGKARNPTHKDMLRVIAENHARQAREDAWLRANGHSKVADVGDYFLRKTGQKNKTNEGSVILPDMLDLLDVNGALRRP